MANREEMKKEAIKRMEMLKILPQTIKEFQREGKINKSTYGGILFWLDDEEKKIVEDFEKNHDCIVYHVIKGSYKMPFGEIMECFDMLYVSNDDEEWAMDRSDIKNDGYMYVYSISNFCEGEYGSITVKPLNGGLARTA